jgi:hypothetical protein
MPAMSDDDGIEDTLSMGSVGVFVVLDDVPGSSTRRGRCSADQKFRTSPQPGGGISLTKTETEIEIMQQ